jgi:hypothetical protein
MARQVMQPNTLPQIGEGLNKKQITALAKQSIENVLEEGHVEQVAEALAVMEEFVKQVRKDERFIDAMRDELMKSHGAIKTQSGARIEMCEAGVTYDYSEDPSWRYMNEQINMMIEQRKELEEKLRKIGPGKMMVDHETGEVMVGALKHSRSTYRITLSR